MQLLTQEVPNLMKMKGIFIQKSYLKRYLMHSFDKELKVSCINEFVSQ